MYIPLKYFILPCLSLNISIYSSFYLRLDLSFSPNFNHDFPLLFELEFYLLSSFLYFWRNFFFLVLFLLSSVNTILIMIFCSGNECDFYLCTFSFELNFLLVNYSTVCCPYFISPPLYRANSLSDVGACNFINIGNSFELVLELEKSLCSF